MTTDTAPAPRTRTPKAKAVAAEPTPGFLDTGELGALITQTAKVHGPNVIRAADLQPRFKHIPTDIFTLDLALHGGFPEGAINLIYGRNAGGKTTLVMRTIAAAQRKHPDQAAVFVDIEGTYQQDWGARHGVDNSRLALIQPDTGEQALDMAAAAISAKEVSIIAVDSLAALTPTRELEKSFEDANVGLAGKMIAQFCRVVTQRLQQEKKRGHRPAVMWINQWRQKVGQSYGDPRILPGGDAQHYFASTKLDMKNKEIMGKDADGKAIVDFNEHAFRLDKSKIGVGIREGEFKMVRNPSHPMGMGYVDESVTVINWAKARGVVTGGGASWRVDGLDEKFGRLQEIADFLMANPEFYDLFRQRLIRDYRVACGLKPDYL